MYQFAKTQLYKTRFDITNVTNVHLIIFNHKFRNFNVIYFFFNLENQTLRSLKNRHRVVWTDRGKTILEV